MSSLKWKVTVYNAIVCSKVFYGLETVQMTSALESKLDAFQQKGLRRILHIPPTFIDIFIDRSWTNVRVREKASDILQYESTNPKINTCIRPLSELLTERRHRLLGHAIRCERNDPMFQATFKDETLERFPAFYRRAGAPRQQWLESNMSTAWARIANRPAEDYEGSIEQVRNIKEAAILCKTLFDPSKAEFRRHSSN